MTPRLSSLVFREVKDFFFLAVTQGLRDLSFPTRDQAPGPSSETKESKPLDCQGSPREVKDLNFPTVGS